jgi:hypothetical protein
MDPWMMVLILFIALAVIVAAIRFIKGWLMAAATAAVFAANPRVAVIIAVVLLALYGVLALAGVI